MRHPQPFDQSCLWNYETFRKYSQLSKHPSRVEIFILRAITKGSWLKSQSIIDCKRSGNVIYPIDEIQPNHAVLICSILIWFYKVVQSRRFLVPPSSQLIYPALLYVVIIVDLYHNFTASKSASSAASKDPWAPGTASKAASSPWQPLQTNGARSKAAAGARTRLLWRHVPNTKFSSFDFQFQNEKIHNVHWNVESASI